jgi:hypothetical protein
MNTCQKHPGESLNSRNRCMGCARESQRKHYRKFRESILETNRAWRDKNHDIILERQRKYVAKDPSRWKKWKEEWKSERPLYDTYQGMLHRCYLKSHEFYKDYGGRGITVSDRWLGEDGYKNFVADVGERPSPNHSIDRRDNNGPYSPSNFQWSTKQAQMRNKRSNRSVTIGGRTQLAVEWAEELGITPQAFNQRLKRNEPEEKLLRPNTKPGYWAARLKNQESDSWNLFGDP